MKLIVVRVVEVGENGQYKLGVKHQATTCESAPVVPWAKVAPHLVRHLAGVKRENLGSIRFVDPELVSSGRLNIPVSPIGKTIIKASNELVMRNNDLLFSTTDSLILTRASGSS